MFQNKKIEIACFNLESAILAQKAGADRVELCANISVGGTTPIIEMIQQAREHLTIDLYIMIRPRGGNFCYSDSEFNQMKSEIETIKKLGVNGFVFGVLNEDNTINMEQNKTLVAEAYPYPCTFHRAFDAVSNYEQALEAVISCGFSTILTSGTFPNVSNTGNWAYVGHYTQMVWSNTTQVGCAGWNRSDGKYVLVCRYSPPGNVLGQSVF
jgi:copper homeostasis protein